MLRVLTLSTLFPNATQPTLGVFVERQTLGLAALADIEVQVVSPVGLPPWPLSLHPHYAARARLPRSEIWKGLTVHRPRYRVLPRIGQARTAKAMAHAVLPCLEHIRETFPFDVIDTEFFWPDGPAAMRLSRALGVPFSIKARGGDIQYWGDRPGIRAQIVEAGRSAGGLLAVSAALKAVMAGLGMPEEKIAVHYTGVDLARFRPVDREAAKRRLGIADSLIVVPGAIIPRKGQALALAALKALPRTSMIFVGDGPDRPRLEAEARRLGLAGRTRFLGNRPHEELPALLAAADVMMLPSQSEGLANVWVEALACGTPVVIGDVGGARELIGRAGEGRLVPLEPAALAAAAADLIANPPDPRDVRRAAQDFTWERNSAELFAHLTRLARHG